MFCKPTSEKKSGMPLADSYVTALFRSLATLSNAVFAFSPIALMAVKQTTTIKANMTAYSTAVGPSSETRKCCTFLARFFITSSK